MNDRKLLNIGCGLLFAVLLAAALIPSMERFVGYVVLLALTALLAKWVLPHLVGELTLAWELHHANDPPHPDDVAAWRARQARETTTPLEARPVWAVVPSEGDASTAELEGPR